MKRAFLVSGPESSGNRLVLSLLEESGCVNLTADAEPDWNALQPEGETIALMRSMPHGGRWDSIWRLVRHIESFGYTTTVLVPVRDNHCVADSQAEIKYAESYEDGLARVSRAYSHVIGACVLARLDYHLVPYESLVLHPKQAGNALLVLLGMPKVRKFHATDENRKHYDDDSILPLP